MKKLTHKDFNTEPIDESKWNISDFTGELKEGNKLEFKADNTPRKYLYRDGKLSDYYWNGSEWVFIREIKPSKDEYNNDK